MRKLEVRYKGEAAGILEETEQGYRFAYLPHWIAAGWPAVSFTLPVQSGPREAKTLFPFFDGLIPEGWLLDLGTRNWKLDPRDRFGLLAEFCQDPVGAVGVVRLE